MESQPTDVDGTANALEKILTQLTQTPIHGNRRVYNRYTENIEDLYLTSKERLTLAINGSVALEKRQYGTFINGKYFEWKGTISFYVYKSRENGRKVLLLDYRQGYDEKLCFGIPITGNKTELVKAVKNGVTRFDKYAESKMMVGMDSRSG